MLWYVFPVFMTALGLFYPNRETWFYALRDLYGFLALHLLVVSSITEVLAPYFAYPTHERI